MTCTEPTVVDDVALELAREQFALGAAQESLQRALEALARQGGDDSLDLYELAAIAGRLARQQTANANRLLQRPHPVWR